MRAPLPIDVSLLRPGLRLAVGLSGGADSVALTCALAERAAELGLVLHAAHLHHGLRANEADADLACARDLAARLGLPFHEAHIDTATEARANPATGKPAETIEEAARRLRYSWFRQLLARVPLHAMATAHTLDDQAETVLIKLLRGAWTEGLGGIHPIVLVNTTSRSGKILRPLLHTRRHEVESFLQSLNQPWREDSSNTDTAFTRNRVRHELLPQLRLFNPSLDHTLANLAELAREEESRWQAELSRLLPQLLLPGKPVRGGGRAVSTAAGQSNATVAVELERLRALDPALRRRVLRAAARQLGARLSFDETSRLLALCGFLTLRTVASKPSATLQLAGNLHAERSARELRLTLRPTKP